MLAPDQIEIRLDREMEIKFATNDTGTFSGHGSVFGNVDSHGDRIAKGAFNDTLKDWGKKGKLPKMLLQHGGGFFGGSADSMVPVGKWTRMEEDSKGLYCEGKLFALDTDSGKLRYEAMKSGELDGLSIGFRTRREDVDYGDGKEAPLRTIKRVDLFEVSIVTFGSNAMALIDTVKSGLPTPPDAIFNGYVTSVTMQVSGTDSIVVVEASERPARDPLIAAGSYVTDPSVGAILEAAAANAGTGSEVVVLFDLVGAAYDAKVNAGFVVDGTTTFWDFATGTF
jgi:HK97 family phage prohead protease